MGKAFLERDEVDRLEAAAVSPRDKLLIRLLAQLGCRVSESLGIEVRDVDLSLATVKIEHLKTRLHLTCPKCGARLGRNHSFCPR